MASPSEPASGREAVRSEGVAWDEIAPLLGTSPLETELRFDPDSPVADRRWPFDIP
jgi:hypothetical protein